MQSRTSSRNERHRGAFSLVELLIVVAVIGIIAAISIMTLTNTDKNARTTTAKAQAQRIASLFAAGMATAAPGFKAANSVESAMDAVGNGSHGSGSQSGVWFQLAGISSGMDRGKPVQQQAKHYLGWQHGTLIYSSTGNFDTDLEGWHFLSNYGTSAGAAQAAAWGNENNPGMQYMAVGADVYIRPRS